LYGNTSGQEQLCEALDIGLEGFLLCLELKPKECKFSVRYDGNYLCQCLLRVDIAKELQKQISTEKTGQLYSAHLSHPGSKSESFSVEKIYTLLSVG
jgi:hypothetical protein